MRTNAIRGKYRDTLRDSSGRVLQERDWKSNTVVESSRILLAALMKNDTAGGIQFLAVGRGLDLWDTSGAPAPELSATDLVTRYPDVIPVQDLTLTYLGENELNSEIPTIRLQVNITLPENFPESEASSTSYPLREFGLFGKIGEEEYMINYVRHPVIRKDVNTTLDRVVRLFF